MPSTRVFLAVVSPTRVSDGAIVPFYFAGGGTKPYTWQGRTDWRGGLEKIPNFVALIGFDETGWTGGAIPQTGTLNWRPNNAADLTVVSAYNWADAPIVITSADDTLDVPVFGVEMTGTVKAVEVRSNAFSMTLSDRAGDLAKPVLVDRFQGTGGIEGETGAAQRIKRRTWGRAFNVEGQLLNSANNIYEFGDPSKPIQAFATVKDKGRSGDIGVVPWQGSIAATYNALAASTPPAGGAAVAPSIACVKWWTTPSGPITADLMGEIGPGYAENVAAITSRILGARSTVALANEAAITAIRNAPAGIHVNSESETIAQVLDRLLLNVSIGWVMESDGSLRMGPFEYGASVETLVSHEVAREAIYKPTKSRRLGYRENYRPQTASEISAALLLAGIDTDATRNDNLGKNQVVLSNFAQGLRGFRPGPLSRDVTPVGGNSATAPFTTGINLAGYFGRRQVPFATFGGTIAAGNYIDAFWTPGPLGGDNLASGLGYMMNVRQYDRVFAESLAAQHRCTATMYLIILNVNGALVEAPQWVGARDNGGQDGDPANFNLIGGIATVTHPQAAFALLLWRMSGTGEANPYIFFTDPAMGVLPETTTVLPPYSDGPPDPRADVTALNQHSLSDVSDIVIAANYQGVVNPGEVPRSFSVRRYLGTLDVSAQTNFSVASASGIAIGVNNAAGNDQRGTVTIPAGYNANSDMITVATTYLGVVLYKTIKVSKSLGPAPAAGGGGGGGNPGGAASSAGPFSPPSTGGYVVTTTLAAVVVGSSGVARLATSLSFNQEVSASEEDFTAMILKWQASVNGAAFVDITTIGSSVSAQRYFNVSPPKGSRATSGSHSSSFDHGGLTSGASVVYRIVTVADPAANGVTGISGNISATPQ